VTLLRFLLVVPLLASCGTSVLESARATSPDQFTAAVPFNPAVDFPALRGLCDTSRATTAPTQQQLDATGSIAGPPTRVFDNLYFVGSRGVSSWAVATSRGIILIDALNNSEEARTIIEPGLRAVGLDPAQIRYVLVTHAHGDHYGGASYLAQRFGARVVMSAIDWRELAKPKLQFDHPSWGRPPVRDVAVNDGDKLTLGDTSIELRVTRTHTPGTVSPIVSVRDRGRQHRLMLWGGTALNFGPLPERLSSYAAAVDQMRQIAVQRGVDVLISTHPAADTRQRFEALARRVPGELHPYVIGPKRVDDVLAKIGECVRANAAAVATAAP